MKKRIICLALVITSGSTFDILYAHDGLDHKQAVQATKARITMIKGRISLYQGKKEQIENHIATLKNGAHNKQLSVLKAQLVLIEEEIAKMLDGLQVAENSLKPLTTLTNG